MSSLMNTLRELGARLQLLILEAVKRIEESALFERLVAEYDSLEVRQQKWIRASIVLLVFALFALLFTLPFAGVVSQKNTIAQNRALVSEMRAFQEQIAVVRQPAPRPLGFQQLPVSNPSEFEDSLKQFTGSLGLGGDVTEITSTGGGAWRMRISELSIRQAAAVIFQLDGWAPGIQHEKLRLAVNPDNKELLEMESEIRFISAPAGSAPAGGSIYDTPLESGGGSRAGGGTAPRAAANGQPGGGVTIAPPDAPNIRPRGLPGKTTPGAPGFDDFDDLPPPSFEEDM